MLRAAFALARVVLLVRCIFSAEARQELRDYVEEAKWWELVLDGIAALFGLVLVGFLAVGLYDAFFIFYNIASTGRA